MQITGGRDGEWKQLLPDSCSVPCVQSVDSPSPDRRRLAPSPQNSSSTIWAQRPTPERMTIPSSLKVTSANTRQISWAQGMEDLPGCCLFVSSNETNWALHNNCCQSSAFGLFFRTTCYIALYTRVTDGELLPNPEVEVKTELTPPLHSFCFGLVLNGSLQFVPFYINCQPPTASQGGIS